MAPSQATTPGSTNSPNQPALIVWSGKGHHPTLLFNDLFRMDLHSREWLRLHAKAAAGPTRAISAKHAEPRALGPFASAQSSPQSASAMMQRGSDQSAMETGRSWSAVWQGLVQRLQLVGKKTGSKPGLPEAHWKELAVYVPEQDRMLVFGGDAMGDDDTNGTASNRKHQYFNDLWAVRTQAEVPVWEMVNPANVTAAPAAVPEPRRAHSGCIVRERDNSSTLVIFGGRNEDREVLQDVWAANLTARGVVWRQLWGSHAEADASKQPAARKGQVSVALPGDKLRMLMFGGRNDSMYFAGMWLFDLDTRRWEQLDRPGQVAPPGRDHFGAFYHDGHIVLYGGRGGSDYAESHPLGDMWEFDLEARTWSEVTPAAGPAPIPRFLYSSDAYTVRNETSGELDTRFVVFGGEGPRSCYLNDVWEYSRLQNTWTLLSPVKWAQLHCQRELGRSQSLDAYADSERLIRQLGARWGEFW